MTIDDLLDLGPWALMDVMREHGGPVEREWLANREYHGVALGNPRFVEWFSWKTFKKVFREDEGRIWGWNVAVEQQGVHGPYVDRREHGERVTYWWYEVGAASDYPEAQDWGDALIIDYGQGGNVPWSPTRFCRDPLVSLDGPDLLLGYTYVALGSHRLGTPTFFSLSRGGPLDYVAPPPRRRAGDSPR